MSDAKKIPVETKKDYRLIVRAIANYVVGEFGVVTTEETTMLEVLVEAVRGIEYHYTPTELYSE